MAHRATPTIVTIAAFALFNVALPEPIVLDLLGVGLAWVGLGLICEAGRLSFYKKGRGPRNEPIGT